MFSFEASYNAAVWRECGKHHSLNMGSIRRITIATDVTISLLLVF